MTVMTTLRKHAKITDIFIFGQNMYLGSWVVGNWRRYIAF